MKPVVVASSPLAAFDPVFEEVDIVSGQAASHGMVQARSRATIAAAWLQTSSYDQRSK
jgi:hypothetical protein